MTKAKTKQANEIKLPTFRKFLPYVLLIGGIIGVFAAGMLTYEKITLLENPNTSLNCDINPIVACGPVINQPQAAAFGVPNPFLGLVGFAVMATIGAGMLAGATYKRWFWMGAQVGVTFAAAFVTWLQYQTIFNINALCPYCMVTWAVTIPIFLYVTLFNFQESHIKTHPKLKAAVVFAKKHHIDILVTWFLIIFMVIMYHFWYYWKTLI